MITSDDVVALANRAGDRFYLSLTPCKACGVAVWDLRRARCPTCAGEVYDFDELQDRFIQRARLFGEIFDFRRLGRRQSVRLLNQLKEGFSADQVAGNGSFFNYPRRPAP